MTRAVSPEILTRRAQSTPLILSTLPIPPGHANAHRRINLKKNDTLSLPSGGLNLLEESLPPTQNRSYLPCDVHLPWIEVTKATEAMTVKTTSIARDKILSGPEIDTTAGSRNAEPDKCRTHSRVRFAQDEASPSRQRHPPPEKALPSLPPQLPQFSFAIASIKDTSTSGGFIPSSKPATGRSGCAVPRNKKRIISATGYSSSSVEPVLRTEPKRLESHLTLASREALQHDLASYNILPASKPETMLAHSHSAFPPAPILSTPIERAEFSPQLFSSLEDAMASVETPLVVGVTMRLLPPPSPMLPPLEFDPYGFAGDFKTYLDAHSCMDGPLAR